MRMLVLAESAPEAYIRCHKARQPGMPPEARGQAFQAGYLQARAYNLLEGCDQLRKRRMLR
jgi:hypothetical protein